MTALLEQKHETYSALRKVFGDEAVQSTVSTSAAPHTEPTMDSSDVRDNFQIPADVKVVQPLKATVLQAVQTSSFSGQTDPSLLRDSTDY